MQPGHRPRNDQSDHEASQADDDKLQTSLPQGEAPGDHCHYGEAVDNEPGSIIDHTLAFNYGHNPTRQAQHLRRRTGSHGIGG